MVLQKGLGLIDKALAIKVESFNCTAEKTQQYTEMQVKMRCTKLVVLFNLYLLIQSYTVSKCS